MRNWYIYIPLLFVLLSYLSSLNAFRLGMAAEYKRFSYFLLFTLLCESFGVAWPKWLYMYTPFTRSNQWFYNFFHLATYLFYFRHFHIVLLSGALKRIIGILTASYLFLAVLDLAFIQGLLWLNTYTDLYGSFIIIFLCISYYYQLLYQKEITSLKTDPMFWISTGLFVYHLGSSMGLFVINVMNKASNQGARGIHLIIWMLAIIMYLTFSIAFICRRKK